MSLDLMVVNEKDNKRPIKTIKTESDFAFMMFENKNERFGKAITPAITQAPAEWTRGNSKKSESKYFAEQVDFAKPYIGWSVRCRKCGIGFWLSTIQNHGDW